MTKLHVINTLQCSELLRCMQVAPSHGPLGLLPVATAADGTNDGTSVALLRFNLGAIDPARCADETARPAARIPVPASF